MGKSKKIDSGVYVAWRQLEVSWKLWRDDDGHHEYRATFRHKCGGCGEWHDVFEEVIQPAVRNRPKSGGKAKFPDRPNIDIHPSHYNQYCSDACRKRIARGYQIERPERECQYCGETLETDNPKAKYCSVKCRVYANRSKS